MKTSLKIKFVLMLTLLVSCSTPKILQKDPDPSLPRKIGNLVFYTGTKNPFKSERNNDELSITYKIRVKNLSKRERKLDLSYSTVFVNKEKQQAGCYNYKRNTKIIVTKKKGVTIFCQFKVKRSAPSKKEDIKKDKVKVLLSIDGLESIRFSYHVKLESDFL